MYKNLRPSGELNVRSLFWRQLGGFLFNLLK
jgi:hypothetical protein